MKCPKCNSMDCSKDGSKIGKGGRRPAVRCGSCGYRGTEDKFMPPLPTHEEVKAALGGLNPKVLPGCSIPDKEDRGDLGFV